MDASVLPTLAASKARDAAHALDQIERMAAEDEGPAKPSTLLLRQRLLMQGVRRSDQV
jgi:hypothetical protein